MMMIVFSVVYQYWVPCKNIAPDKLILRIRIDISILCISFGIYKTIGSSVNLKDQLLIHNY